MKRILSFLLLAVVLLVSCKNETPVSFSSETMTEGDVEICNSDPCPEISIQFITAEGDGALAETINENIVEFVNATLYLGEDLPPEDLSIAEAMLGFSKRYQADLKEFPDLPAPYEAQVDVFESYTSEDIISITMTQYSYTGGAHGYGSTHFLNVDRKTGEELDNEELFSDLEAVKKLAESQLRANYEIPEDANINSMGFDFENDTFELPESIGFDNKQLILWYNPYDIASYAEGAIEISIPIKEVKPYLAFQ